MSKLRVLMVLAVALVCLPGCFEVDQEYTLNPDGSGKVVHKVKQPDLMGQGASRLKEILKEQLTSAEGVDAWSDVSVELTDDGSTLFTGTAYFSDLNSLKLEGGDAFRFRWDAAAGGAHRLSMATGETGSDPAGAPNTEAEIREARTEWNQMRPMMQGLLGSLRWRATFHLPGNVSDRASFETSGPSVVTFSMTGDRYFQVMDELMSDEAFLEGQAKQGSLSGLMDPGGDLPPDLVTRMFGENGVYALVPSSRPQFDYASAVTAAQDDFDSMMTSLPVEAPKQIAPPARGGDFKSVKVVGTGFVTDGSGWKREGATVAISAELPGSVITAEEGILLVATSDDGTNLLPEQEWDRQISVSLDSDDQTTVSFELSTLLPPHGAKGFREISGLVYYKTASAPDEEVELFSSLEPGTRGSRFGATLGDYEPGYMEGTEHVNVSIDLPREEISEIVFLDAAGRPVGAEVMSTSWSSDSTSLSYSLDGTFPRNGKAIIKVRKELTTYEVPFKAVNIDLSGRAMK
jgi:hypothetical protein